jgi:hypothetical protein
MHDYHAIETVLGPRDFYPNADADAYCDFQSQTIHLNRISRAAFLDDVRERRSSAMRSHLGTMLHEITHWANLIGTLWGREYLRSVYGAMSLIARDAHINGPESEFHRFVDLHDRTRRIMLGRYYRTEHPAPRPHDHRHTWGIQFSSGREFDTSGRVDDARPIVFARLLDNPGGDLIARQPIVAGALLEVNAVWSEIRTNLEVIGAMPVAEQAIEEPLFRSERLDRLYDPGQTVYTAPARLLAQFAGIVNAIDAYRLASAVSHVVLNLDDGDFARLAPPADFEAWSNLFDGFRASRDRGFAYAVVCACGGRWVEGRDLGEWLDAALAAAGLRSAASITAAALARMRTDVVVDEGDPLGRAERYLLSLGERVLEMRSSGDTALTPSRLDQERLPTPSMFDADGEAIQLSPNLFDTSRFSPEAHHLAAARLHTWTLNFLNACR